MFPRVSRSARDTLDSTVRPISAVCVAELAPRIALGPIDLPGHGNPVDLEVFGDYRVRRHDRDYGTRFRPPSRLFSIPDFVGVIGPRCTDIPPHAT